MTVERRTILRGYLHLGAAAVAVAGCVVLVLLADSPRAYVGGSVFAACLIALYTISGAYHTIPWGPRMASFFRRLDHAMIFAVIAGSYTPFCLLAASDGWGITILALVWSIAGVGMAMKIVWPDAPRWLGVSLYIATGWVALVAATELADWFAVIPLLLLGAGGVLYTIGGVIYAVQRPNPFPRVFGYHEVFHAFVIGGSVLHYSVVAGWLVPA